MNGPPKPRVGGLSNWRFALLLMGLIFVFSSVETHLSIVQHFPLRDKGVHFLVYGLLGWLCAQASVQTWPSLPVVVTAGFAFCVSTFWGFSDELHQAFVPGRTAEFADIVADTVGSGVGVLGQHFVSGLSRAKAVRLRESDRTEREEP